MRILIVDDRDDERRRLGSFLEKKGCETFQASGWREGLVTAANVSPDLIISGPFDSCLDCLRLILEIKSDPLLSKTPFVCCTASRVESQDREFTSALGAAPVFFSLDEAERSWADINRVIDQDPAEDVSGLESIDGAGDFLAAACRRLWERLGEKSVELDKTREEIEEFKRRYEHILESVNDYIYTVKLEDGIPVSTSHGPGCAAVTGYAPEEFEADPDLCFRMVHPDDIHYVRELTNRIFLDKNQFSPFQHRIIHKDGRLRWIKNTPVPHYDRDGRLVAYDGLISDITEYKKLEDQFHHAQKMEAVGVLAGGIAHDFNNILTAIIGYGNLLQSQLENDERMRKNVDQMLAAAERAANLVHGLLAFSRKQVMNPRSIDLNGIISNVERLLSRLITEDIELDVKLADSSTTITADPGQIEQIIMNLVTNARDAMPKGGTLTIETRIIEMDQRFLIEHGFGVKGSYVMVTVADTGMGMDEQARERIFEPFFTTKPMGKGTGLGLSIVYGIVKQHNGFIELQSEPGAGSIFRIYFPLVEDRAQETASPGKVLPMGGNQTILIADDDTQVRTVIKIILDRSGYTVLEAEDGEKAVRRFKEHRDDVDLLIFDLVMPRKNGMDAYEEIRKIRPDIKTIFMSGYTADVIDQKGDWYEGLDILAKPVSPYDLLQKVKYTLNNNH